MARIVVFGSCNFDTTATLVTLPRTGESQVADAVGIDLGGKGCNQAIAASKAGATVDFFCALGDDFFGDFLKQRLREYPIQSHIQTEVNSGTGTGLIFSSTYDNLIAYYPGANKSLAFSSDLVQNLPVPDVVIIQNECSHEVNQDIVRHYKGLKVKTVWNPAPANSEFPISPFKCDILVFNETEFHSYFGFEPELDQPDLEKVLYHSRKVVGTGQHLVVTLGGKGSLYVTDGNIYYKEAYSVSQVDSTAAGDTFVGYLATGLANQLDIHANIDVASAAGALAVTKQGAASSIPELQQVQKFMGC